MATQSIRPRHSLWICGLLILVVHTLWGCQRSAAADSPQVVYLHTEFIPYQPPIERQISYRLMRELVRQAFVVAAQHEFGVIVRDGSLYETAPEGGQVLHLALLERAGLNNQWQVKLFIVNDPPRPSPARGLWNTEPIWEQTFKYRASGSTMYAPVSSMYEKASRSDFIEALKTAGVRRQPLKSGTELDADLASRWDQALLQVDFAVQFGVLRDIHRSIRADGETPAHLERLCRGYANLSVLTQHQWNSASEVFAARSWIYGRRLYYVGEDRDRARIHQAYAFALAGAHNHALKIGGMLRDPERLSNPAVDDEWIRLIQPYLACDRSAVQQVGNDNSKLRPWSQFLWFQLTAAYRIPQWIKSAGDAALQEVPAAYGIYEMMARCGGYLGIERYGAAMAPVALRQNVRSSLAATIDLPAEVSREPGLRGRVRNELLPEEIGVQAFSTLAKSAAIQLRKISVADHTTNLSWSVLATLLEDEQFGQIANLLVDSLNAVEHSNADLVDVAMPFVAGHRYAAFIDSFRFHHRNDWDAIASLLRDTQIEDPRSNMRLLPEWLIRIAAEQRQPIDTWMQPMRNFTMQGLLEHLRSASQIPVGGEMVANEFRKIVPNHELAVRWEILTSADPGAAQLSTWEQKLRDDPISFRLVGRRFEDLGELDAALRCYQRSMELLPTLGTARLLARHYKRNAQLIKWERTLVDYLQTESYGLDHASAQRELVRGLIEQDRWRDAKPYAVAAAQTYQSVSMEAASFVLEGLAEWDESEKWVRALSESYPTSSGVNWYEWCRRTGRGDLVSARPLAAKYFDRPGRANSTRWAHYCLMENDIESSLLKFQQLYDKNPAYKYAFMLHQLHARQGDDEQASKMIEMIVARVGERVAARRNTAAAATLPGDAQTTTDADPDQEIAETGAVPADPNADASKPAAAFDAIAMAIAKLIKTTTASSIEIADLDHRIAGLEPHDRSGYWYIFAAALDRIGSREQAVHFWGKSLATAESELVYATLSGWELSKITETSRPDRSSRDPNDL